MKIDDADKDYIFKKFGSMGDYEQQNLFLQKNVRPTMIKRRKRKNEPTDGGERREQSFRYFVEIIKNDRPIEIVVCQKAFLCFLGIKKSRLRRKIINDRSDYVDKRGQHSSRPNRTPSDSIDKVKKFLSELPARESHYSRTDQSTKKYRCYLGVTKI